MHVYRSNSVETLFHAMVAQMRLPLPPLVPECIVVQSKGMSTWLSMRLSERFGIWCHPDFPHPRQFVQRLLRSTLGDGADLAAKFNRERLTFAVAELLPALLEQPEFASIRRYVLAGRDDMKQLQLAERIAAVFDQYAVYRPEMVLGWEEGKEFAAMDPNDRWQPILWRAVVARLPSPARLMRQAFDKLRKKEFSQPSALPQRVFLFGIAALPPIYLSLFAEAARHAPLHLFVLSPAQGYWADICSQREQNKILAKSAESRANEDLHLEVGHPLLASLGILGRDFQRLLEERVAYVEAPDDLYRSVAAPRTALQIIQQDILFQGHRRADNPDCPPRRLAPDDSSIVLHACHSPLREVEVLQDQVLAMLNQENLQPGDIVVMVPDIDRYAPLIEAVFDREPDDPRFIPFRIADRSPCREAPLIEAFFSLLGLLRGRLRASEVLDFFANEAVYSRFNMAADDLEQVKQWVVQAGIRWGIDEKHRALHEQPEDRQNTWRFGFDRLLLGYAMPGGGEQMVGDVLPYDELEGQHAELVGAFMNFCETLFDFHGQFAAPCALGEWRQRLVPLLDDFFRSAPEESWQLQKIRDAMSEIVRDADEVSFSKKPDLPIVERLLRARLEEPGGAHGFLEGGVTFCAMLPMRSIPFQVVCLLGMNDGDFPRVTHPVSFDLLAREPRPGDRSRRNEDRHLFLETLLSAGKRLFISFVAGNSKDNSSLPPSVVVEELIDCLADSFVLPDEARDNSLERHRQRISQRFVVRQPLQPFSPRYFDGSHPALFSYAPDYCEAAHLMLQERRRPEPFLRAALEEEVGRDGVALKDLQRFFRSPVKWFLQERLGLFLTETEEDIPDREPITLDHLDRFRLGNFLLAKTEEGLALDSAALLLQGAGVLPLGRAGNGVLTQIGAAVHPLRNALRKFAQGGPLRTLVTEIALPDGTVLSGELIRRFPGGLVRATSGRLNERQLLSAWLEHLFLCAVAPADQKHETVLIGKGDKGAADTKRFKRASAALGILADLAELFRLGQRQPLPFFPKSSYAFASAMIKGRGDEEQRKNTALKNGRAAFSGSVFGVGIRPEGEDSSVAKVFDDFDCVRAEPPWGAARTVPDYGTLAQRVYAPLFDHLEDAT